MKTTRNLNFNDLPELPMPDNKTLDEIEKVCTESTCDNFNTWLNKIFVFKVEYNCLRENYEN